MKTHSFGVGLVFSIVLSCSCPIFAQSPPAIQWQKCLGGSGSDYGFSIVQTRDGGYALAGMTNSHDGDITEINGKINSWVVKLNSSGSLQWQRCLGGSNGELSNCIIQTLDGGYAIIGSATSNDSDVIGNPSGNAGWIVKLDSSGKIQWQQCLEGQKNGASNVANSIIQTMDGNYVIVGQGLLADEDCFTNSLNEHVFIVKLNSSGNRIWERCYGGNNYDKATSIVQTFDGGYALCGSTTSTSGDISGFHIDTANFNSLFDYDIWVVKLDSSGIIQWQKCLGGTADDQGYAIVQAPDSGYVIAGQTQSTDGDVSGLHSGNDLWAIKLTPSGGIQWQKCFGGSGDDFGRSLFKTYDGGYVIAGYTSSGDGDVSGLHLPSGSAKSSSDVWVLKVNSSGMLLWQKCLGGGDADIGNSVIQTSDGGYAIAGRTRSDNGDVSGYHLGPDSTHPNDDMWVVKLNAVNAVESHDEGFFSSNPPFQIFKIYPNPSSEKVNLKLFEGQTAIRVLFYDMTGRQYEPVRELNANIATINVNSLPNGVYMTRITYSYLDYIDSYTLPLVVQH